MTAARASHSATLLADGRVFIAGGFDQNSPLKTAELYDPATATFTPTGNMADVHEYLVSVLLSNGKVLISGAPSAELYDPAKGTFAWLGPMVGGSGSAVLLEDGSVLIPDNAGVSLYSVTLDSIRLASSLPDQSFLDTATILPNGRVLIAGGSSTKGDDTTNVASVFDPRRGTLEGTGLLLFSRSSQTATLLPGGNVLIVGGYDGDGYDTGVPVLWDAEQYDPFSGSFAYAGTLRYLREGHTATLLPDGTVLITAESPTKILPPNSIFHR